MTETVLGLRQNNLKQNKFVLFCENGLQYYIIILASLFGLSPLNMGIGSKLKALVLDKVSYWEGQKWILIECNDSE